jgi:post-segregation antitoxin (ccd killing protein)
VGKKLITLTIDDELNQLLKRVKRDYCINLSALVRKLLLDELNNTHKYRRENKNV